MLEKWSPTLTMELANLLLIISKTTEILALLLALKLPLISKPCSLQHNILIAKLTQLSSSKRWVISTSNSMPNWINADLLSSCKLSTREPQSNHSPLVSLLTLLVKLLCTRKAHSGLCSIAFQPFTRLTTLLSMLVVILKSTKILVKPSSCMLLIWWTTAPHQLLSKPRPTDRKG